jgi:hypothetical protein
MKSASDANKYNKRMKNDHISTAKKMCYCVTIWKNFKKYRKRESQINMIKTSLFCMVDSGFFLHRMQNKAPDRMQPEKMLVLHNGFNVFDEKWSKIYG